MKKTRTKRRLPGVLFPAVDSTRIGRAIFFFYRANQIKADDLEFPRVKLPVSELSILQLHFTDVEMFNRMFDLFVTKFQY